VFGIIRLGVSARPGMIVLTLALMRCIVLQVKKGYKDKVGIILYNVESGDGSVQDGFQELVAMGDLNCKKIQLMQEHAKSGTYVEAGKTNSTKPCKRMFHESNSGSCHLTNAVRAAQQVCLSLSIPSADPCCGGGGSHVQNPPPGHMHDDMPWKLCLACGSNSVYAFYEMHATAREEESA